MIKCLDDNDVLMYSTCNEGKSVFAKTFIRTLNDEIYKNITANDSKSYLDYLNNLVDECNDGHHRSIGKELIHPDYSA